MSTLLSLLAPEVITTLSFLSTKMVWASWDWKLLVVGDMLFSKLHKGIWYGCSPAWEPIPRHVAMCPGNNANQSSSSNFLDIKYSHRRKIHKSLSDMSDISVIVCMSHVIRRRGLEITHTTLCVKSYTNFLAVSTTKLIKVVNFRDCCVCRDCGMDLSKQKSQQNGLRMWEWLFISIMILWDKHSWFLWAFCGW